MRELLLQIIELSGLKPSEVADKCEIKRQQMYRWLKPNTTRIIKFEAVKEIADKLGINVKISIESKNN